ncbi:primosomal protein N' [Candidatus Dependentiae bacterium]|nr:primosomal protein N' [Candidatus Dependentiae bacterium]
MYIRVKLLNGFKEPLIYTIPDTWDTKDLVGTIIEVPLQKRVETAVVEEIFSTLDATTTYTIRTASSKSVIPSDAHYFSFIQKLSSYYAVNRLHFLKKIRHFLNEKEQEPEILEEKELLEKESALLTPEQQEIVNAILPSIKNGTYFPALLNGVTGSGKTEIYKKLIIYAWSLQKSSLFLLPEVSLAAQFTRILRKQLPSDIPIYSFHSATGVKEKRALWAHLVSNRPVVVIGVHLPILLPIPHIGLIIIDEEHEVGYQEKKHPKINTKEAALLRAQISHIPLIAGSATPSISSLYNVSQKKWNLFELKKRFAGAFPTITLVKLTTKKHRPNFWISSELAEALTKQLEKKEQTIIFLNRRGHSFFIQCKECGHIPHCVNCSVSLTYHADEQLVCHYCSFSCAIESCSSCKKFSFLKKGIGTQQVVTILEKLFPQARIGRADLDTTMNKKKWIQTVTDFQEGALDILVGTQTITKGYHFPRVTLVGVLWADINLGLPFYNAAEVTLQQLIQVAGRAGRQSPESSVIIQTMIDHPIYNYSNEQNYGAFYLHEIQNRKLVGYPPFIRFAEIELKNENESLIIQEAKHIALYLKKIIGKEKTSMTLLGPSQPPVHMIKKVFIRKIYLKAETMAEILALYATIKKNTYTSQIFFTPNPLS